MSTTPTTPQPPSSSTPATTPSTSTGPLTKIKHFFGIVWHGVVIGAKDTIEVSNEVIETGEKIEPDLVLAADVVSLINPTAGNVAKEIVTAGFTALGAFTEAFEASETTIPELLAEAPEFMNVTVRTEALAQIGSLLALYKTDFDKIKADFLQQVASGTPSPATVPASAVAKK